MGFSVWTSKNTNDPFSYNHSRMHSCSRRRDSIDVQYAPVSVHSYIYRYARCIYSLLPVSRDCHTAMIPHATHDGPIAASCGHLVLIHAGVKGLDSAPVIRVGGWERGSIFSFLTQPLNRRNVWIYTITTIKYNHMVFRNDRLILHYQYTAER